MNLVIAVFLLAHASIHAAFLSPRPAATASGPAWPFELSRSGILGPLGIEGAPARVLGIALIAVTLGGFALAALAAMGIAPAAMWVTAVTIGAVASMVLIAVFFHPWLVLGMAIDGALLWAVLLAGWTPEGVVV